MRLLLPALLLVVTACGGTGGPAPDRATAFQFEPQPEVPDGVADQGGEHGDTTPCPEPEGGWQSMDVDRTGEAALNEAISLARSQIDHAGVWIDRSSDVPGRRLVLNAAYTGDLAEHEEQIRSVWGGPLCLVQHAHTLEELREIQEELPDVAASLGLTAKFASLDEPHNVVRLGVVTATREQRSAITDRYGVGAVVIEEGVEVHLDLSSMMR
jgi:hypothetical protein